MAALMATSLPDELLHEILFRVKDVPAALFRCAAVCKGWRGLVAEPTFLRRCWQDKDAPTSASLVGFFSMHRDLRDSPCFIPTPRSALGPGLRALSSFVTAVDPAAAALLDGAVPLVSRHGLLLVRVLTLARLGINRLVRLAVCNLLTGACHVLPPLKSGSGFSDGDWNGYAILTDEDCRSGDELARHRRPSTSSTFFKAVIVSSYCDGTSYGLRTFSFSSGEASWEVRTGCSVGATSPENRSWSPNGAVVRRGTAHWLLRYCAEPCLHILNLDTRTGRTSLTKIPILMRRHRDGDQCLSLAASGALSLLWMPLGGTQQEIWEEQKEENGGSSEWIRARAIELKQPKKENVPRRVLRVVGVKCGTLLVHDNDETVNCVTVYAADLETGAMEEAMDWPFGWWYHIRDIQIVPVEVDWLTIFASRLGSTYI